MLSSKDEIFFLKEKLQKTNVFIQNQFEQFHNQSRKELSHAFSSPQDKQVQTEDSSELSLLKSKMLHQFKFNAEINRKALETKEKELKQLREAFHREERKLRESSAQTEEFKQLAQANEAEIADLKRCLGDSQKNFEKLKISLTEQGEILSMAQGQLSRLDEMNGLRKRAEEADKLINKLSEMEELLHKTMHEHSLLKQSQQSALQSNAELQALSQQQQCTIREQEQEMRNLIHRNKELELSMRQATEFIAKLEADSAARKQEVFDLTIDLGNLKSDRERFILTISQLQYLLREYQGDIFKILRLKWVPDDMADRCHHCDVAFGMMRRKHHCRRCGNVVCAKHIRDGFKLSIVDLNVDPNGFQAKLCTDCVAQVTPRTILSSEDDSTMME